MGCLVRWGPAVWFSNIDHSHGDSFIKPAGRRPVSWPVPRGRPVPRTTRPPSGGRSRGASFRCSWKRRTNLSVRAGERRLGVELVPTREVDGGKEQVADLVGHGVGVAAGPATVSASTSAISSRTLAATSRDRRPIETHAGRLFLGLLGAHQRGQRVEQAGHDRDGSAAPPRPFFLALDLVPAPRMAAVSLPAGLRRRRADGGGPSCRRSPGHGVEIERAALAGHLRVHDDVQEQVAEFLAQVGVVVGVDGGEHLVGFLDERGAQAGVGLLAVPGAAVRARAAGRRCRAGGRWATCSSPSRLTRPAPCAAATRGRVPGWRVRRASGWRGRAC